MSLFPFLLQLRLVSSGEVLVQAARGRCGCPSPEVLLARLMVPPSLSYCLSPQQGMELGEL